MKPNKKVKKNSSNISRSGRSGRVERTERVSPFSERTFMVDGIAAVSEYARFTPDRIKEIFYAPQQKQAVERLAEVNNLRMPLRQREAEPGEYAAPVTASVELKASPFDALLSRLSERKRDVIIALDHITDPRNLGAIIRSAAFFGVREVLVPERRQVLLTQAAVNTAQGGFALTDLIVVVNLSRALSELKDRGYWTIGAAMDGEPYSKLANVYEKTVLVLGSEDSGLSRQVSETCDRLAAIPGQGRGLDSLNVSVAAGIFLCEFTRVNAATP